MGCRDMKFGNQTFKHFHVLNKLDVGFWSKEQVGLCPLGKYAVLFYTGWLVVIVHWYYYQSYIWMKFVLLPCPCLVYFCSLSLSHHNLPLHQVINFFVGLLFLRLLEQLGPQILYTAFATFCLMAVAFVRKNVLETKGKSLQEIEIALLPAA